MSKIYSVKNKPAVTSNPSSTFNNKNSMKLRNNKQKNNKKTTNTVNHNSHKRHAQHKYHHPWQDWLKQYLNIHRQAIKTSLCHFLGTPLTTLITILVIGIALALPTGLFVILQNVEQLNQKWSDGMSISVYLQPNTSDQQAQQLVNQLNHNSQIKSVDYISPQQGLAELKQQTNLAATLSSLANNPLPAVIVIHPMDAWNNPQSQQLLDSLQKLSGIEVAEQDMHWLKRLTAIIDLGKRSVLLLALLLGMGVLLIIGNSIHIGVQQYANEIELLKLTGATPSYIRRPFLYFGLLYGGLGVLIAWLLLAVLLYWLNGPIITLAQLYNSLYHLQSLSFSDSLLLLVIGLLLGWLGAWIATQRHLSY